MFDFDKIDIQVTEKEIFSKISELEIFKKYCTNFIDLDKSFTSELRVDNNPGCRIYIANNSRPYYKDFASGDHLTCIDYVRAKYRCTYFEALNIIATDFNIKKLSYKKSDILIGHSEKQIQVFKKIPSYIEIIPQVRTIVDYNYWNQFNIDFDTLDLFDVFSAKYAYLFKGDKRYTFEYLKTNPLYAYRFTHEQSKYSYKLYWPLHPDKKRKWIFSGKSNDIEGFDQLPLFGELLIITKSLKDVMCYYKLGYNAISLQGEANKLESDFVQKLSKRFKNIIINYDNDEQGIKSATSISNKYGFKLFYFSQAKDLSDLIKLKGVESSLTELKNYV